jgi:hypothetical protein
MELVRRRMGTTAEMRGGSSACALLRYSQVEVWTDGGGVSVTPALATWPPNPRSITTSAPEARMRFMAQSNPIRNSKVVGDRLSSGSVPLV